MNRKRQSPERSIEARLVLLLIITYPLNIEVAPSVRPVDFAIGLLVLQVMLRGQLRRDLIGPLAGLLALLFLSAGWGVLTVDDPIRIAFGAGLLLKYIELALLLWALASLDLSHQELRWLLRSSAYVYLAIVAYVLGRVLLAYAGLVRIRRLRPDFPFTKTGPGMNTAGHLMGMYLTSGLVLLVAYRVRFEKTVVTTVTLAILSLGAVLLTGSRTPFIALAATAMVGLSTMRVRIGRARRGTMALVGVSIVAITVAALVLANSRIIDFEQVSQLLARATNFDFANDQSANARILKTTIGLHNVWESGIVIGPGVFRFGRWFDNGLMRILHDFGFFGFLFLLLFVARVALDALADGGRYGRVAFLGLVCFSVGNVATEFFLVPRASVPFVVATWLLIRLGRLTEADENGKVVNGANSRATIATR